MNETGDHNVKQNKPDSNLNGGVSLHILLWFTLAFIKHHEKKKDG